MSEHGGEAPATRTDLYRVAAFLRELDRMLHPVTTRPAGEYRLPPILLPPLPPTGAGGTGARGAPAWMGTHDSQPASGLTAPDIAWVEPATPAPLEPSAPVRTPVVGRADPPAEAGAVRPTDSSRAVEPPMTLPINDIEEPAAPAVTRAARPTPGAVPPSPPPPAAPVPLPPPAAPRVASAPRDPSSTYHAPIADEGCSPTAPPPVPPRPPLLPLQPARQQQHPAEPSAALPPPSRRRPTELGAYSQINTVPTSFEIEASAIELPVTGTFASAAPAPEVDADVDPAAPGPPADAPNPDLAGGAEPIVELDDASVPLALPGTRGPRRPQAHMSPESAERVQIQLQRQYLDRTLRSR